MNAIQLIALADRYSGNGCGMPSSADLCLRDAVRQLGLGDEKEAQMLALKSLAYRIGMYHPDYIAASASVLKMVMA